MKVLLPLMLLLISISAVSDFTPSTAASCVARNEDCTCCLGILQLEKDLLYEATTSANIQCLNALIEKGIDVNQLFNCEGFALLKAVQANDTEIVIFLLEKGADPDLRDQNGNTALNVAVKFGHCEIVSKLLAKGAAPEPAQKSDYSPFIQSSIHEHLSCMRALHKHGASINKTYGEQKNSALILAVMKNNTEVIKILIEEMTVDINYQNINGDTALTLSAYCNQSHSVQLLLGNNTIDIDHQTARGETALMLAANTGYFDIVKQLVENGARLDLKSNAGVTALNYAIRHQHKAVFDYLSERTPYLSVGTPSGYLWHLKQIPSLETCINFGVYATITVSLAIIPCSCIYHF